jgi:hypothetical protein
MIKYVCYQTGENTIDKLKTSVWKPLKGPLKDWPLAFCKLSSLAEEDLKKIDLIHPDDTLESYRVHYNPKQQWGYFREQQTSEMVLFKSADSVISGTGKNR